MLTQEDEFYLRLILLLYRCGTLVLKQTFEKKLADHGLQLHGFLQVNREAINKLKDEKVLTLKQYSLLFPNNAKKSNICEWDISILSCLLLNLFTESLQPPEKKAIEHIRTFRNNYAAHCPDCSIDGRTFFRKWNELSTHIKNLGNLLGSSECLDIEKKITCVRDDPIDTKHAIEDIKEATAKDHSIEQQLEVIRNLLSNYQEGTRSEIRGIMSELIKLKPDNPDVSVVIIGEVTVSGRNPEAVTKAAATLLADAEKSKTLVRRLSTVEDDNQLNTLFSFFARVKSCCCCKSDISMKSYVPTDEQNTSLKLVTYLVKDIENVGGEVIRVTKGSVLLHIKCHSTESVLRVCKYFQSSDIERRLDEIAICLTGESGSQVSLAACIQVPSLKKAMELIQEKQNQVFTKRVRYDIKCRSTDGVLNVVKIFGGQDTSPEIAASSESLSNEVGSPVTLKASLDTDALHKYVLATRGIGVGQEVTKQDVKKLESSTEKETKRSPSLSVNMGEKPETSHEKKEEPVLGQFHTDAIKHLKMGENRYEFAAFLLHSDKDGLVSGFVKDELNKTLQSLTGINRDLICIEEKCFSPRKSYINIEFIRCLIRSSIVIVIVTDNVDGSDYSKLKDADKLGKQIVPILLEGADNQKLLSKGLTNLSKVRRTLRKEHDKYTLNTTWREMGISILRLVANTAQGKTDVKIRRCFSLGPGFLNGIRWISEAVQMIPGEKRQTTSENAQIKTDNLPPPMSPATIIHEILYERRRGSGEESDDLERIIQFLKKEQTIEELKERKKLSALTPGYASLPLSGRYGGPLNVNRRHMAEEEFKDLFSRPVEEFKHLP